MKLIIQIPCLNEAETLPLTVAALPRQVEGFDELETLVIDDGSTDSTVEVAQSLGITYVHRMNGHQGLARAFMAGLIVASENGGDVIVNIDADNQYVAKGIHDLVEPILRKKADIVIGARPISSIRHFSRLKRILQKVGSFAVRTVSGAEVRDAPSGFRAMTRDAALRLNVFGDFTYTIETIIQARLCNLRIVSVPVEVNAPTRPSRLFRSNVGYICRAILTVLNAIVIYRPGWFFCMGALFFLLCGVGLGGRYLLLMLQGEGPGHVQSVIACAVFTLCGVFMAAIGIVAHLQGINRKLLEELRYLLRFERVRGALTLGDANNTTANGPRNRSVPILRSGEHSSAPDNETIHVTHNDRCEENHVGQDLNIKTD